MSAEYLTAYASVGTFVVIAVTAITAVVQIRHIHGANQLTGLLHLTELWRSDRVAEANRFIMADLPGRLQDPAYRAQLLSPEPDRQTHHELVVADILEQTGSYIKYGMIDGEQFLDLTSSYILHVWSSLTEVVALRRVGTGRNAMYENFEYLSARAMDFDRRHRDGNYPRRTQRLMTKADWEQFV
ncbi:MAG: hypothetical protein NVSMB31_09710 [Vulcanimicrobiaceae bacterium]